MIQIEIDIAPFRQDCRKDQDWLFSGILFHELIGTVFGGNPQHCCVVIRLVYTPFLLNFTRLYDKPICIFRPPKRLVTHACSPNAQEDRTVFFSFLFSTKNYQARQL